MILDAAVGFKPTESVINGGCYKKQLYHKPATESTIGKLSYPEEPEVVVPEPEPEVPEPVEEEPFPESDDKGEKPNNFAWIEEGLFATCSTPPSYKKYDLHYQWLIENQFTAIVACEANPPKLVKHRENKLENILIRIPNYQAPSLDQITQVLNIIDGENLKGKAVVVCDKNADGASAVVAACYLIRKYRYLYQDGLADARKMLAVGEAALPRPFYENKVAEYFMQRAQEGWSGHWFPNDRVNGFHAQVIKGDRSGDYWYEPAVHDVNTLPTLK